MGETKRLDRYEGYRIFYRLGIQRGIDEGHVSNYQVHRDWIFLAANSSAMLAAIIGGGGTEYGLLDRSGRMVWSGH
jgi:hypothetical protein